MLGQRFLSHLSHGVWPMILTNRRQFLATTASATAMTATGPLFAAGKKSQISPIDAHVHVWTPDVKTYSLSEDYTKKDMQPPSFTPEQLFAHCRPEGVERIVLIQMSFYGTDNSYMLDV